MSRILYGLITLLGFGVVSCVPQDMYGCPPPVDEGDTAMYHPSDRVVGDQQTETEEINN